MACVHNVAKSGGWFIFDLTPGGACIDVTVAEKKVTSPTALCVAIVMWALSCLLVAWMCLLSTV